MDASGNQISTPKHKPPFPDTSSLIAGSDLVLPARLCPHFQRLNAGNNDDIGKFLNASLDLSRLNAIGNMIWVAGYCGAPRSLHYQKLLRREIVPAEQLELHLVRSKSRMFIKPLPNFLLNYDFWEAHICCAPSIYRAACGLLYSYCGLIRYDHDMKVAQELGLISPNITYRAWTEFARTILAVLNPKDQRIMDPRWRHAELLLQRLNFIYVYTPQRFSAANFRQTYPLAPTESYVPVIERYNSVVSAFGIIVVILTAMQVGLATERLQSNHAFQQASLGFTAFSIVLSAMLIGFFALLPVASFVSDICASLLLWKLNAKASRVAALPR